MDFKTLSREELLNLHHSAAKDERASHARLIAALKENIRRELFKEMGYRSLHEFVVHELHYAGGAAFRRVSAAYAALDLEKVSHEPVETKIEKGTLSLSSLSHVNRLLKQERHTARRHVHLKEKRAILKAIEGKSEREAEKSLTAFSSQALTLPLKKTRMVAVTQTQTRLELMVDDKLYQEMEEAMHLLSHVNPRMDHLELFSSRPFPRNKTATGGTKVKMGQSVKTKVSAPLP